MSTSRTGVRKKTTTKKAHDDSDGDDHSPSSVPRSSAQVPRRPEKDAPEKRDPERSNERYVRPIQVKKPQPRAADNAGDERDKVEEKDDPVDRDPTGVSTATGKSGGFRKAKYKNANVASESGKPEDNQGEAGGDEPKSAVSGVDTVPVGGGGDTQTR
jgi:hypothetical protein